MTVLLVPGRYLKDTVVMTTETLISTDNSPSGSPRTIKGNRGVSTMQGWWAFWMQGPVFLPGLVSCLSPSPVHPLS